MEGKCNFQSFNLILQKTSKMKSLSGPLATANNRFGHHLCDSWCHVRSQVDFVGEPRIDLSVIMLDKTAKNWSPRSFQDKHKI